MFFCIKRRAIGVLLWMFLMMVFFLLRWFNTWLTNDFSVLIHKCNFKIVSNDYVNLNRRINWEINVLLCPSSPGWYTCSVNYHIDGFVQDYSISILTHWRYCSLALSHQCTQRLKTKNGYIRFVHGSSCGPSLWRWQAAWWRNQMETFSALLALFAGNSPVTVF